MPLGGRRRPESSVKIRLKFTTMAAAELHTFGELTLEVLERRLSRRGQDVSWTTPC
jgi:hypothetical protein